jgi:hypothetical protein
MVKSALIALLSICLVLAGCTAPRTVYLSDAGALASLEEGDRVDVTLKSGEVRKLKLTAIDATSLTGTALNARQRRTTVQLALAEVQSIDLKKFSLGKAASFGSGILVGAGALLFVLLAASHDDDE